MIVLVAVWLDDFLSTNMQTCPNPCTIKLLFFNENWYQPLKMEANNFARIANGNHLIKLVLVQAYITNMIDNKNSQLSDISFHNKNTYWWHQILNFCSYHIHQFLWLLHHLFVNYFRVNLLIIACILTTSHKLTLLLSSHLEISWLRYYVTLFWIFFMQCFCIIKCWNLERM